MLSLTSLLNLRPRRALAAARLLVAALALAPAAASASARPVKDAGKTKEGSKITFTLEHGWLDGLSTMVPTTCVSAQGGTPQGHAVAVERALQVPARPHGEGHDRRPDPPLGDQLAPPRQPSRASSRSTSRC
jgi:hypothetical protein